MAVITFSRFFPKGHPKAGQPTYFMEKIKKSLMGAAVPGPAIRLFNFAVCRSCEPKHHTIRSNRKDGRLWKVGDTFTPKVWGDDINPKSGRSGAYQSKQIQFAPDIEIKKVWSITKVPDKKHGFAFHINGDHYVADWEFRTANIMLEDLAKNDGLSKEDFVNWFPENFAGQIICWNEAIYYP